MHYDCQEGTHSEHSHIGGSIRPGWCEPPPPLESGPPIQQGWDKLPSGVDGYALSSCLHQRTKKGRCQPLPCISMAPLGSTSLQSHLHGRHVFTLELLVYTQCQHYLAHLCWNIGQRKHVVNHTELLARCLLCAYFKNVCDNTMANNKLLNSPMWLIVAHACVEAMNSFMQFFFTT